jgi:hypothetical protein
VCAALKPDTVDNGQRAIEWGITENPLTSTTDDNYSWGHFGWVYEDIGEKGVRFWRENKMSKARKDEECGWGFVRSGSARHLLWEKKLGEMPRSGQSRLSPVLEGETEMLVFPIRRMRESR